MSESLKNLLKRPEAITTAVASIVTVVSMLVKPLLDQQGIAFPEEALNRVVLVFWTVVLAAVLEGRYKGVDYVGGLKRVFGSLKMQAALGSLALLIVNGLSEAFFDTTIPEDAFLELINVVLVLIGVKGTADVLRMK